MNNEFMETHMDQRVGSFSSGSAMMVDVVEAQGIVLRNVSVGTTEEVALKDGLFRTIARDICCDRDHPPFDRALMDGYAVRAANVVSSPVVLRVVGQVAAGYLPTRSVEVGEAIQINTGAPIPSGADVVIRVEETELVENGTKVRIGSSGSVGQFITKKGAYAKHGQVVLRAGQRLTPLEIAIAASVGADRVSVYKRPRIAVISTGDELVEVNQTPLGAQIRNSNGALLEALAVSVDAEAVSLGSVKDDPRAIRAILQRAMECELVCLTGGVSAGEFDFVPRVLEEIGATVRIRKMAIKPGRPVVFATGPKGQLIFGLPGNPISAFVGFELLIRPALAAMQGRSGEVRRGFRAKLVGAIKATTGRRSYWPGRAFVGDDGGWRVEALSWMGSGDPFGMSGANALIEREPNSVEAKDGNGVSVILLNRG
ncbi:MAG: gephyrin-like molybdotransferase Glp [Planctomycetota bacterium]